MVASPGAVNDPDHRRAAPAFQPHPHRPNGHSCALTHDSQWSIVDTREGPQAGGASAALARFLTGWGTQGSCPR